jgi:metallo-beta-lactamase class B
MLMRALLLSLCLCASATAQQNSGIPQNAEWRQPFPAFKLIGNVYWVGTYDLSTYLITTDAGHILINSGFEDTVPQIVEGVEKLGFKMADVKILLATHAHGDHVAGLAELKRLTGAQMWMSEADAVLLEDGGISDFRFGDGRTPSFAAVKVDRRLKDQDTIALGGVTLTAHHHPGHTKGATSFTMTCARRPRLPRRNREHGQHQPRRDRERHAEVPDDRGRLCTHVRGAEGAARRRVPRVARGAVRHAREVQAGDAYDPNRFVDPKGYLAAVERLEGVYREQLARERAAR